MVKSRSRAWRNMSTGGAAISGAKNGKCTASGMKSRISGVVTRIPSAKRRAHGPPAHGARRLADIRIVVAILADIHLRMERHVAGAVARLAAAEMDDQTAAQALQHRQFPAVFRQRVHEMSVHDLVARDDAPEGREFVQLAQHRPTSRDVAIVAAVPVGARADGEIVRPHSLTAQVLHRVIGDVHHVGDVQHRIRPDAPAQQQDQHQVDCRQQGDHHFFGKEKRRFQRPHKPSP